MKAYAFVFAKTHGANRRRTSSPLANPESENFSFAFAGGTRAPLLRNPPLCPSNISLPACPFPFFFSNFPFLPCLLTNQLKTKTSKKNNALTKFLKWHLYFLTSN
jgi:hypothetical protein